MNSSHSCSDEKEFPVPPLLRPDGGEQVGESIAPTP